MTDAKFAKCMLWRITWSQLLEKDISHEMRYTMQFLLIGFSMIYLDFLSFNRLNETQCMQEKVVNFESIVSGHCTTLLNKLL